jgi:hypothetical protein
MLHSSDFGTSMPTKSQEESISSMQLTSGGRLGVARTDGERWRCARLR